MKAGLKSALFVIVFGLMMISVEPEKAQCAQRPVTVASNPENGAGAANGLTAGILFLIASPFIAASIVGFVWYRNFRRKEVNLNIRYEKLHLN
jgi:hypothetical protein